MADDVNSYLHEAAFGQLSSHLVREVEARGGAWLRGLAERGELVGELRPLRRLAWQHLLGVIPGEDAGGWAAELEAERRRYARVLRVYEAETDVKGYDPTLCNPLSRNSQNPFLKIHQNDELQSEIRKDIERTYPESEFLSSDESRKTLQRLLFHWCREHNPATEASDSYRQGMNEIIAVVYSVVKLGEYAVSDEATSNECLGARLCSGAHSEADTFAIFTRLMELGVRPMYMTTGVGFAAKSSRSSIGDLPRPRSRSDDTSAILARCQFINETILRTVDEELFSHFQKLMIEPQLFLLRWLRVLFCREFELKDTFILWDGLFATAGQFLPHGAFQYALEEAESRSSQTQAMMREAAQASAALPLVDFVAAALLQRMRAELLPLDQTECLRRLLSGRSEENSTELIQAAHELRAFEGTVKPLPPPSLVASAASTPRSSQGSVQGSSGLASGRPSGLFGGYPGDAAQTRQAAANTSGDEGPRRSQLFFSAAAQRAQGLLQAGKQAAAIAGQRVSQIASEIREEAAVNGERALPADPLASGSRDQAILAGTRAPTQSLASWVGTNLLESIGTAADRSERCGSADESSDRQYPNPWQDEPEQSQHRQQLGGLNEDTVISLQRRAETAERECDMIKRKASEWMKAKNAEFVGALADRDKTIEDLRSKLQMAEEATAREAQAAAAARQAANAAAERQADLERQLEEAQMRLREQSVRPSQAAPQQAELAAPVTLEAAENRTKLECPLQEAQCLGEQSLQSAAACDGCGGSEAVSSS